MTGEITLRGRALAIGGLKEKTMAALRNGIRTVLIPADNVKDLEEIDQTVRSALHFVPVEEADQALAEALCQECAGGEVTPAAPLAEPRRTDNDVRIKQ